MVGPEKINGRGSAIRAGCTKVDRFLWLDGIGGVLDVLFQRVDTEFGRGIATHDGNRY